MKSKNLVAALFALSSSSAFANELPVYAFNGFSFYLDAVKLRGAEVPQDVTNRASLICASVEKKAELQLTEEYSDFRSRFYYICL